MPVMLKSASRRSAATCWTFAILCAPALYLTQKMIPETKVNRLKRLKHRGKQKL
jgi:hypothetical protein